MHPLSILLLGIAMSTDAFAAAVGKGAAMRDPRLTEALRAGLIFGAIEGLTPLVGWALGNAAAPYVTAWDHWIAFTLLGLLGLRMIHAGLRAPDASATPAARPGFWTLATTGLATSIDALAVGVGLAFVDVDIVVVAAVVACTTLVMVSCGILLGRVLGALAGRRAEIVGGALLVAIGVAILFQHLGAA
ncbi:manganese efflux pump MntP family protein [Luteimonas vadosa]|uniref:Putative manganese efflux pump MntP n=1 Tax=Luteimonas vadosa TaxID=1165507 RepID=A0ABP9DRP6_9GAMM